MSSGNKKKVKIVLFQKKSILCSLYILFLQLLTEEYSQMSPNTMEVQGFTNQREYDKIWALTKPASPDTTRKITGFLNMVKDRADEKFTNVTSTGMC